MTIKKTLLLAAAACMTATGMAQAYTYQAQASTAWNQSSTWTSSDGGTTYPQAGDTAYINGFTVSVSAANAAADVVHIENGGRIQVNSNRTLTITSGDIDGAASRFPVDGRVILNGGEFEVKNGYVEVKAGAAFEMQGPAPKLKLNVADAFRLPTSTSELRIVTDSVIYGVGSVLGGDSAASIIINTNSDDMNPVNVELLLDSAKIHGGLQFYKMGYGTASLANEGQIRADNDLVMLITDSLDSITDAAGSCGAANATWAVVHGPTGNSSLEFDMSVSLTGAFYIDEELYAAAPVTTSGPAQVTLAHGFVTGSFTPGSTCP